MIQVKKDGSLLTVTKGAYDSYYKHLGYEPVGAEESHEDSDQELTQTPDGTGHSEEAAQQVSAGNTSDEEDDGDEDTEDSDEVDLSEIPLGELSHSQLFEYADQLGLEYEGTPGKKELRALIKAHLNQ